MTLFIQTTDFKRLPNVNLKTFMPVISTLTNKNGSLYNARMKKANEKSDVEISYLFQFDRIELIESSIVTMLRFSITAWMKRLFKTIF